MDEEPHQPHDKLFKQSFGDPATAAAFLREQIPEELTEAIDWDSLQLESGSFVDSTFRASESDLLFSAALDESPAYLYLPMRGK